jgi:hypothetical protein
MRSVHLIAVAVHGLRLGARPVLVSSRPSPQGGLFVDLQPDPKVPLIVELGAEGEHAVDDQDRIRRSPRDHRGMIDLRQWIDAAQHAVAGSGSGRRLEQQLLRVA